MSFTPRPGERIVYEGHPSWRGILSFYLKGILITGLLVAGVWLWGKTIGDGVDATAVTVVLIGGAAITLVAGFLLRVSTSYTITNKRLHVKRGIVSREVQETRLSRVQDVSYTQSLIERLLQVGDIDFDTASADATSFVFAGVADPSGVVQSVHAAQTEADSEPGDGDDAGLGTERA